jgi:hypothetical protein
LGFAAISIFELRNFMLLSEHAANMHAITTSTSAASFCCLMVPPKKVKILSKSNHTKNACFLQHSLQRYAEADA